MDAMVYFLLNSTLLLTTLGLSFFLLGLWLGWLLWGIYKERVDLRERELSGTRARVQSLQIELYKRERLLQAGGEEGETLYQTRREVEQLEEQLQEERQRSEQLQQQLAALERRSETAPRDEPLLATLRLEVRRLEEQLFLEQQQGIELRQQLAERPEAQQEGTTEESGAALAALQQQVQQLEEQLFLEQQQGVQRQQRLRELEGRSGDSLEKELESLRQRLRQVQHELEMEQGSIASLNADLSSTALRAEKAEQRLTSMMRERDALRESLRDLQNLSPAATPEASAVVHLDSDPTPTEEQTTAQPRDDLTVLRGVGEALQQRLNGCGVYTLQQIAAWDTAQVEAVALRLGCGDRIREDQWVEQAQAKLREREDG